MVDTDQSEGWEFKYSFTEKEKELLSHLSSLPTVISKHIPFEAKHIQKCVFDVLEERGANIEEWEEDLGRIRSEVESRYKKLHPDD